MKKLLLSLSLLAALTAQAADTKIVFIAGRPSHGPLSHEHRAGCLLLAKSLAGVKGVVTEVHTNGWVSDEKTFADADAVVIYADGGGGHPAVQGNHKETLGALVKRGVVTMEEAAPRADIFVTATGNEGVLTVDHMRAMKNMAIVSNIGHFDSEIEIAGLANMKWTEIKPQVDEVEFADGKKIIVLAKGRLVNLGCATGHPSFVMSSSFTNQVLAQIELWTKADDYQNEVYVLPKHLDEKVAALHLEKLGVKLSKLSQKQADYIGVPVEGPFKPDHYRY